MTEFETGVNMQQLQLFTGKKAFMAGVHSEGQLGSLLIIDYPFAAERPVELQIHEQGITRMCLNFDHTYLFTASRDGSFSFLQINDKDPRRRDPIPQVLPFSEVVIPQTQRDTILEEIVALKKDIQLGKDTNRRVLQQTIKEKNEILAKMTHELQKCEQEAALKKRELEARRDEDLAKHKAKTEQMKRSHKRVLEAMQRDHQAKKAQDEQKY